MRRVQNDKTDQIKYDIAKTKRGEINDVKRQQSRSRAKIGQPRDPATGNDQSGRCTAEEDAVTGNYVTVSTTPLENVQTGKLLCT